MGDKDNTQNVESEKQNVNKNTEEISLPVKKQYSIDKSQYKKT